MYVLVDGTPGQRLRLRRAVAVWMVLCRLAVEQHAELLITVSCVKQTWV